MFVSSKTDIGMKRSNNEDSVFATELNVNTAFAVVCDGMGGASGGQIASKIACDVIKEKIMACSRNAMPVSSVYNMLLSAITTANVSIYDTACANPDLKGMGTTVVCAFVQDSQVCIGHAGDSRAYLINSDGIRQLTKDHSLVQEMVDRGDISISEMKEMPMKNIITRAMGVEENIEIDFSDEIISDEDTILLCSDGLTNFVDVEEIYKLSKSTDISLLCNVLVDKANENGGGDNISVAIISNNGGKE